jgi:RES domain-containing protein
MLTLLSSLFVDGVPASPHGSSQHSFQGRNIGKRVDLATRLVNLVHRARDLRGSVYRSAAPKYANSTDLLSGEGSRKVGGRWNPVGVAAVYGSFTPQTALEEMLAHANYYRLPIHASMPRTFIAIEFTLKAVLDLTDGRNRQALAVSEKRLMTCDWRAEMRAGKTPLTQQVGLAAANAGLEGLLVRSAADSTGVNLIVFVENPRAHKLLRSDYAGPSGIALTACKVACKIVRANETFPIPEKNGPWRRRELVAMPHEPSKAQRGLAPRENAIGLPLLPA